MPLTSAPKTETKKVNAPRVNIIAILIFLVCALPGIAWSVRHDRPAGLIIGVLLGFIAFQSPKVARQWERAVVLCLGRYRGLRGPGLF